MKSIYYIVPLINFFVASIFGLLLRGMNVVPINGISYSNLIQAHSHIALLGWLYLLVYVLLVKKFSLKNSIEIRYYQRLFWLTQLSVIGMVFTFPLQGYAAASIAFSTLHIICSYAFVIRLWRKNKTENHQQNRLLKTALFFLVFSTLGIACLGPVISVFEKSSHLYQICIQFYLHFQFDGWLLTAFLTLLLATILKNNLISNFNYFYFAWIISILLTFSIPLNWFFNSTILHSIKLIGILLQISVIIILAKQLFPKIQPKISSQKHVLGLIIFIGICTFLRLGTQLTLFSETFSIQVEAIRSWIIGFIHLNMLGILSGLGIFILLLEKELIQNQFSKLGIFLLIIGILLTEGILFIDGFQIIMENQWIHQISLKLLISSIFLPISILCFIFSFLKKKKYE